MEFASWIASGGLLGPCGIGARKHPAKRKNSMIRRAIDHSGAPVGARPAGRAPGGAVDSSLRERPDQALPETAMTTRYLLREDQIPRHWYNILADLPTPPAPVLHPQTKKPVTPQDLLPIFPKQIPGR